MKKIICPECGEIEYYLMMAIERHHFVYDANGEPMGETDIFPVYESNIKRCSCGRKIKIIDDEDAEKR